MSEPRKTLDILAEAVQRELARPGDWRWTFDHMTQAERLRFDGFLVRMEDPLAWEAGTCEHRFGTRVRRMAELERERRAGK